MKPVISYLTSHRGSAHEAYKCISSVANDCMRLGIGYEHLIYIDGGSVEGFESELAQYLGSAPMSNLHIEGSRLNIGKSCAVNMLIDKARGDYLFFIDSDDVVLPGHTKESLDIHEGQEESNLLLGSNYLVWSKKAMTFVETSFPSSDISIRRAFPVHPCLLYSSLSISSKCIARYGLRFNESLKAGLDYEMYSRALTQLEARIKSRASVIYTLSPNGLTSTKRVAQLNSHFNVVKGLFSTLTYSPSDRVCELFMHFTVTSDYKLSSGRISKEDILLLEDAIKMIGSSHKSDMRSLALFWHGVELDVVCYWLVNTRDRLRAILSQG